MLQQTSRKQLSFSYLIDNGVSENVTPCRVSFSQCIDLNMIVTVKTGTNDLLT